jgi:hypothetical protein
VKFVEGTSIMTSRDLFYICRRCLVDKNYELGCYFLMDKFRVGRCTEGTIPYYGVTSKSIQRMTKMLSVYAWSGFVPRLVLLITYRYLSENRNHVINMELKHIEHYWQADSDRDKSSKFTNDLSTRSIRKLSKNILAW